MDELPVFCHECFDKDLNAHSIIDVMTIILVRTIENGPETCIKAVDEIIIFGTIIKNKS